MPKILRCFQNWQFLSHGLNPRRIPKGVQLGHAIEKCLKAGSHGQCRPDRGASPLQRCLPTTPMLPSQPCQRFTSGLVPPGGADMRQFACLRWTRWLVDGYEATARGEARTDCGVKCGDSSPAWRDQNDTGEGEFRHPPSCCYWRQRRKSWVSSSRAKSDSSREIVNEGARVKTFL